MKVSKVCGCFIVLFAGLIIGCSSVDGLDQARRAARIFFEDRFENGGAGSDEFYSKLFWDNTDAGRWRDIQKVVNLSLGKLLSVTLVTWHMQDQLPTGQLSGTFAVLVFETKYEKGSGREKLTLLQRGGLADFEIVGHQFDSQLINEMVLKGITKAAEQNA